MPIDVQRYNPLATTTPLSRVPLEVRKDSIVPVGFSYLVKRTSREILPEEFAYLMSVADVPKRKETGSYPQQTNRIYAYDLRPYAIVREMEGRPFRYMCDDVVQAAVIGMTMGVTQRGQSYKRGTIAQSLRTLLRCVDHANKADGCDIQLDGDAALCRAWGVERLRDDDGKAIDPSHVDAARRHMIRPLAPDTRRRLAASMVVLPSEWVRGGPSSRPGLELDHGMRVGCRLVENLGIHFEDVLRITVADPTREYPFVLRRTKGADTREVQVPGRVLLRQQDYISNERAACVEEARELHGSNWDEPAELLVNTLASGVHVGHATQPSSIQRDFRVAQERLGMVRPFEGVDEDGGPRTIELPWHCYHDQRHTYAFAMYKVALRRREADPVAFVQRRLGHADRGTTDRIYLFPDRRRVAEVGDIAVAGTGAIIRG
ncbi:hypothetical protein ASG29_06565 [Sphingomonas sp. Leaf412]|uniref:hypothetical protein n=1 Tax=Sphingomonas sp. Leaf412 TaxID=1736370 RepID=UPI0006FFAC0A|nr:hypothetical protein [Sphingomonas sp. Leaf412]KQT33669.1 hypothetical protein ASG29_06565 [Sphingomonas sp. Leaf412]